MNDPMNQSETSETRTSQDTIEYSISKKIRKRQKIRLFAIVSLAVYLLLLLFYFTLPPFQCKSLSLAGGVNLTAEDCVLLSENNGYKPLLLLDKKKSSEKLLSSSEGFILDASVSSDGFSGEITITEDFPHARFSQGEDGYFLSGKTVTEMSEAASHLSLSTERKNQIVSSLREEEKSLPIIHLPEGVSLQEESIHLALSPLSSLSSGTLSSLYAIQYVNDSGDATWNNVADVLLYQKGKYLLLKDCLSDCFSLYFSETNFPGNVVPALLYASESLPMVSYSFKDVDTSLEVYSFTPYVKSDGAVGVRPTQKGDNYGSTDNSH